MQVENNLLFLVFLGAVVGAASGYLGSFMVIKRMSLVGDALSHIALPGMAIALTLGGNPMLGALIALTLGVVGVWYLAEKTDLYVEALVGIFFTTSLAVGLLITPEPELFESLFGNIEGINIFDAFITILAAVVIFTVTKLISKKLILGVVSEDLAKTSGINTSKMNLIYLLMVGLVVALGVKFVGTLLTGALVIIPAVAAKNIAKGIREFHFLASFVGVLSAVVGVLVAKVFSIPSGPSVVLVSVGIFIISIIFKRE